MTNIFLAPYLFNYWLTKSIYPDRLKAPKVTLIFKTVIQIILLITDHCLYLLQSINFGKKLLQHRLSHFLEKYNFLSDHQCAFRSNSSTIYALCDIHDILFENIDQKLFICCLFFDLSKAFATVDHIILVRKLGKYFGIRGLALDLLKSYLTNRFQYKS